MFRTRHRFTTPTPTSAPSLLPHPCAPSPLFRGRSTTLVDSQAPCPVSAFEFPTGVGLTFGSAAARQRLVIVSTVIYAERPAGRGGGVGGGGFPLPLLCSAPAAPPRVPGPAASPRPPEARLPPGPRPPLSGAPRARSRASRQPGPKPRGVVPKAVDRTQKALVSSGTSPSRGRGVSDPVKPASPSGAPRPTRGRGGGCGARGAIGAPMRAAEACPTSPFRPRRPS